MTRDPIAVSRRDSERGDAAEIIQTHDFLSLPVIDKTGASSAPCASTTCSTPRSPRSAPGSSTRAVSPGRSPPQSPTSRPRCPGRAQPHHLAVLLFVAETATGTVLRHFEDELAKVVALSFFIPLLIGTGGNAGSQTVSTIIRALALGEVRMRDVLRVLAREVVGRPPARPAARRRSPSAAPCCGASTSTSPPASP